MKTIRIGIVGEIGAGKTFVASKFGYPTFDADKEVQKIYFKSKSCFKKFRKAFPKSITKFPINKSELKNIILRNKVNIKKIGKIVHPYVNKSMMKFIAKYKKKKFVVLDIPLIIENKIFSRDDVLIFIKANKKKLYKRLLSRNNFDLNLYKRIKKNQLPLYIKRNKCKFIINNNFNEKYVVKQIESINQRINLDDRSSS